MVSQKRDACEVGSEKELAGPRAEGEEEVELRQPLSIDGVAGTPEVGSRAPRG